MAEYYSIVYLVLGMRPNENVNAEGYPRRDATRQNVKTGRKYSYINQSSSSNLLSTRLPHQLNCVLFKKESSEQSGFYHL